MSFNKSNHLLRENKKIFGIYELIIFFFFLFEFFVLTSEKRLESETFVTTHYLMTYETGFISRALIGSVVSLFTDRLTIHLIFVVGAVSYLLLTAGISMLLGHLIRNSESTEKTATTILIILFLSSPLSVTYLLGFHFARLDIYWIILTLSALICLKKSMLIWTVPLLCGLAVCVHPGFLVTYMPALFIPILYEVYRNNGSKKHVFVFFLSCSVTIALFAYFQIFPQVIPYANAAEYADHLTKNAAFQADSFMVYLEYFAPLREWLTLFVLPLTATYAFPLGLVLFTFSVPLIWVFSYVWKNSIILTKDKFLRFIFILCASAPLAFLAAAVFGNDWDRWWAAAINTQFILVFYFIISRETNVLKTINKVGSFLSRHILLLLLIIIFTNSLTFSHASSLIFHYIFNPEINDRLFQNYFRERIYGSIAPAIFMK